MPRGKELDPQMRSRICELKSIGWGARRIHRKHPDIPLSTISNTIALESKRNNNVSRSRSSRPRQLSEEQREHIWNCVQTNPTMKLKDLVAEVDGIAEKRSIQKLLKEMRQRKKEAPRAEDTDKAEAPRQQDEGPK